MKKYIYKVIEFLSSSNVYDTEGKLSWYGWKGWKIIRFEEISGGTRIWMEKEEEK